MHKKLIFVAILLLLSALSSYGQDLVSTDPLPRNAVLEEFTGIYCGFCPDGHKIAKQLKDANPGRVVLINIHEGSYAIPQSGSGHPDFRSPWGAAIQSISKLVGYPAGMMNRQNFVGDKYAQQDPANNSLALSRSGWGAAAADVFADANSPVNIGAKAERIPGNKLRITVELYYTADAGQSNKLNVALLENGYIGYQGGSLGSDTYEHNHILRDLVTGQWGEAIKNTTKGTLITRTYDYDITSRVDPVQSKLEVAVFVTKADNSYIYTGIDVKVPDIQPAVEIIKPELIKAVKANGEAFSNKISIKNITNNALTISFTIAKSTRTPADWKAELGSNTSPEISITPGETFKAEFMLTPGSTIGLGDATITIKEVNSEFQNVYKHTISCISKEISSLEIIAPTEIATRGLKKTLTGLGYTNFFELQTEDFADFVTSMNNLKTVVWNYSITLSPSSTDFDIYKALADKGVNQFVCGYMLTNYGKTNLETFGLAPLGFSTQGYGSSPWLVWLKGVKDDPITGNITADIEGNLIQYLINVYTVTNSETTKPFLTFKNAGRVVRTIVSPRDTIDMSGPDSQFGFRITNSNSKTVFLSLSPYVFKQVSQRNLIVDNIMKWLNGINGVEEEVVVDDASVYPNPAEDFISLGENLTLKPYQIISLSGSLIQEGIFSGKIQLNLVPSGTYFVLIDGQSYKFVKK
jgi:hypothetical protein